MAVPHAPTTAIASDGSWRTREAIQNANASIPSPTAAIDLAIPLSERYAG